MAFKITLLQIYFKMSDIESEDFSDEDPAEVTEEPQEFRNEDNVNRRAGHVAVAHNGRVIVWGGYMENQVKS